MNPPASNLFARVVGKEGKVIEGHALPAETEITSYAYGEIVPSRVLKECSRAQPWCDVPENCADEDAVVQRDKELYAPDPDAFRPERWLESAEHAREMDDKSYVFGMGPRVSRSSERRRPACISPKPA